MNEIERPSPVASSTRAEMLAAAVLLGGFIGVVLWFDRVDFYNKHFFDTGAIVFADNIVRIVFVGILSWLIYAPGAAVVALVAVPGERAALSPAERAVLGFGVGVGIWHVAMLILGVLGLYYRSVLAGLCLVVLIASSRHFAHVAVTGCRAFADRFTALRQRRASPQEVGAILIAVVAAWLLLRRGLGRQPRRGGRGNELGVVGRQPRGFEHLAAEQPIEAADAAAGRAQPLAFEIGRGLDAFGHHVGLRQARRQAPNLLHLGAAADLHRIGRDQRGASRGRRPRRRRFSAVELDDVGVDAMLAEVAELQRHIRRSMNHVRRRDGDADIDLAHRGAIGLRR